MDTQSDTAKSLEKKIEQRPTATELEQKNILKGLSTALSSMGIWQHE